MLVCCVKGSHTSQKQARGHTVTDTLHAHGGLLLIPRASFLRSDMRAMWSAIAVCTAPSRAARVAADDDNDGAGSAGPSPLAYSLAAAIWIARSFLSRASAVSSACACTAAWPPATLESAAPTQSLANASAASVTPIL